MRASLRLAPLLLALPLGLPGAALAQGMIRPPPQAQPQAAPAPALPGLAARRAPAPIAGDPNANLSPNAALFDAINRGDLAAARDAVARGANLEARNAIGLSPIDAAVDQGRNDIAFYLLSARDTSRAPLPEAGTASLSGPPPTAPQGRPARRQTPAAAADAIAAAVASQPPAAPAPATPRAARLWAGDGGTPRPRDRLPRLRRRPPRRQRAADGAPAPDGADGHLQHPIAMMSGAPCAPQEITRAPTPRS